MSTEVRLAVTSADGTELAVWVDGEGPPLVLVHGSMQDHTASRSFVDELRGDLITFALDRRGFGASGDSDAWAIEREFEDVAAVVEHVAGVTGEQVAVWGHSYGANCAMGGAALSDRVGHLVLYEPSLGLTYPPGSIEDIEAAVTVGDHERAAVEVLRGVLELTDDEIDEMRSTPRWSTLLASAPTIPRECRVEEAWVYEPGDFATITAPTLMLAGSESPAEVKKATEAAAAAIGAPTIRVLEGHAHLAHRTDPAMVAAIVFDFVSA